MKSYGFMEDAFMDKKAATDLLAILTSQNDLLDSMIGLQKLVRQAVTEKNWVDLDNNLFKINELTENFTQMEAKREELCCQICGVSGSQQVPGMHQVSIRLPDDLRPVVKEVLHQVRQKLSVSKVENDALNDYIRITKEFLQEVFTNALMESVDEPVIDIYEEIRGMHCLAFASEWCEQRMRYRIFARHIRLNLIRKTILIHIP